MLVRDVLNSFKNVKSSLFCLTRFQNFTLPAGPDLTSRLTALYVTAACSTHPVDRRGHHWCILAVRYGRRHDHGPGTKDNGRMDSSWPRPLTGGGGGGGVLVEFRYR